MDVNKKLDEALSNQFICRESYNNILKWLTHDAYTDFKSEIHAMIEHEKWEELDDSFYKYIEFGTGGRRGHRGPGPNRINTRTLAESAQGLADYIHENGNPQKGVVVAFDTRYGSKQFAQEISRVFAANGIKAYLYQSPRSTPQLSFSIRHLNTQAGCMISASHNPPSDNGIKVSWEDGGQVLPPHDIGIINKVTQVAEIKTIPLKNAEKNGMIEFLDEDIDRIYIEKLKTLALSNERAARVAYSPLHGVGGTNVVKLLEALNFDVVTVEEQMKPDPEFSSVKNQLPNPELPAAMELVTSVAHENRALLAMASDPDADRLGATIPTPFTQSKNDWMFLTGNQIGVLIYDHVLRQLAKKNKMPEKPVLIKTIVTTEMLDALSRDYNVEVIKNLLVGFKYIAEVTDHLPSEKTVIFTTEESHGYNRGTFVRDKDSAPAALHMSELVSELAVKGKTIYGHLMDLYRRYGCFYELTRSIYYHGKKGRETMNSIMEKLRSNPPQTIAGETVYAIIDRSTNEIRDGQTRELIGKVDQHIGNVMVFHLAQNGVNRITARPSGTEPKIKFYAQLWRAVDSNASDEDILKIQSELEKHSNRLIDAISGNEG